MTESRCTHSRHPHALTLTAIHFYKELRNTGWRIDYWLVSDRLMPQVTDAKIHTDIMGSDHCPVEVEVAF